MFILKIKIQAEILIDDEDLEKILKHDWRITGSGKGYAMTRINGKLVPMHRLMIDIPFGKIADHINGDTFDNRKENLRIATQSQNRMNCVKQVFSKKIVTSKFKGVHKKSPTRNWSAQIHFNKRTYNIGSFKNEEEAAKAYDLKAKELFGQFAKLNFK